MDVKHNSHAATLQLGIRIENEYNYLQVLEVKRKMFH